MDKMYPNQHLLGRARLALIAALAAVFVAGCASEPQPASSPAAPSRTRSGGLTPYIYPSATPSPIPTENTTPTPLPSPTSTPRTHIVQQGEDMFGIAYRYRISLEDLMAANPDVKPNFLSVGQALLIPGSATPEPASGPSDPIPSPTAVPLETGPLHCASTKEGGAWCFFLVRNNQELPLEGISATVRLADNQAQSILPMQAFLPLDRLLPGQAMPVSAYYPPTVPEPFQASAEVSSALPSPEDGRYLPTRIENIQVLIDESGLSAQVALDVFLDIPDSSAKRVWVAAVAYDSAGSPVGLRRWENSPEQLLTGSAPLSAQMHIYSVSEPISRVEVFAEARP